LPGYTLPDGLTLKNKLGATSHEALEAAEGDFVTSRLLDFERRQGPKGQFDAAHLKAIHRHLFQDIYEWAGRTRDERVKLPDGTIATEPILRKVNGKPFVEGPLIAGTLDRITAKQVALKSGSILLLRGTDSAGPTARRLKEQGEGILGVRIGVTDLGQARSFVGNKNISAKGQSVLVLPENATGVWLQFQSSVQ
jgi:hypothetical protein